MSTKNESIALLADLVLLKCQTIIQSQINCLIKGEKFNNQITIVGIDERQRQLLEAALDKAFMDGVRQETTRNKSKKQPSK